MGTYLQDILNQPKDLSIALDSFYSHENRDQIKSVAGRGFGKVIFAGMGSSNFCNYGASILLNNRGFYTSVLSAGELLHYETGLLQKDTLLVLVSQSGESAEILRVIERLPQGVAVAAVTNNPRSTLGRRGDWTFALNVPDEESVTTRTYLSSLLLVDMLATAMCGDDTDAFRGKAEKAIGALAGFLQGAEQFTAALGGFAGLPACVSVIGRGPSLSTARAGALFLREVVKHPAMDFDSGEFRHGPFEMVEEGFFGVVVAPEGPTRELNVRLAGDIAARGGRALLIAGGDVSADNSRMLAAGMGGGVDELLSPVATIAPVQLLADCLAGMKGVTAGKFRWGAKITASE